MEPGQALGGGLGMRKEGLKHPTLTPNSETKRALSQAWPVSCQPGGPRRSGMPSSLAGSGGRGGSLFALGSRLKTPPHPHWTPSAASLRSPKPHPGPSLGSTGQVRAAEALHPGNEGHSGKPLPSPEHCLVPRDPPSTPTTGNEAVRRRGDRDA